MPSNSIAMRSGRPELANQWLAEALEAGKMGAWFWDLASDAVFFDSTQVSLTGIGDSEGEYPAADFFSLIHPDDAGPVRAAVDVCISSQSPFVHEFRIIRPDGTLIWLGARGRVVCDDSGRVTHLTGLNWDVTDARKREEQARITALEMAHRVKNVIALVQGIARMSSRNHDSIETFLPAFIERTNAVATVNNLILSADGDRTSLANIVGDTLSSVNADGRIRVAVHDFEVNQAAAQTLVLVLNELATNAIKYGALEDPDGVIDLRISIDTESDGFLLEWEENRARAIGASEGYRGFGSQVLLSLTRSTYTGDPSFEWRESGVRYSCTWKASEMSIGHVAG